MGTRGTRAPAGAEELQVFGYTWSQLNNNSISFILRDSRDFEEIKFNRQNDVDKIRFATLDFSNNYKASGPIVNRVYLNCEDVYAEYEKTELFKSRVLKTVIDNNPCILLTLAPFKEGLGYQTQWMKDFNRVIDGFSMYFIAVVGSAVLLPYLVEMLPQIIESLTQEQVRQFLEGALIEAFTYHLVNEYFNEGQEIDKFDFTVDVIIAGIRNVVKYEKYPQAMAACIQGIELDEFNNLFKDGGDVNIDAASLIVSQCVISGSLEYMFSSPSGELMTQIQRSGTNKLSRILQKLNFTSAQKFDVMAFVYKLDEIAVKRGNKWLEKMKDILPTESGTKAFDMLTSVNFDISKLSWRNFERLTEIIKKHGTEGLGNLFSGAKDVNRMLIYLEKSSSNVQQYTTAMNKIKANSLFEGTITINGNTMKKLDFFENEVEAATYFIMENASNLHFVKAHEGTGYAIEIVVNKATNVIMDVIEKTITTLSSNYIKQKINDDE
jgi:hypothetical protein